MAITAAVVGGLSVAAAAGVGGTAVAVAAGAGALFLGAKATGLIGGKDKAGAKSLPDNSGSSTPSVAASLQQAQVDVSNRRRTAYAGGGNTAVSDFSGVVPEENLGVKTLLGS